MSKRERSKIAIEDSYTASRSDNPSRLFEHRKGLCDMTQQGVGNDRITAAICCGEVMNIAHLELNALIHAFFCS
jgi:hypothetical protein